MLPRERLSPQSRSGTVREMVRPIRPDDLFDLRSVGDVALDPTTDRVVFTVTWPDRDTDENRSQLHEIVGEGPSLLLDGHRDTRPRFSPDGRRLAFLRAEPKGRPRPAVLDLDTSTLVERCVSNWESFIGTSDIGPWFAARYCDATIEGDVAAIRRQSPITYAADNRTPTLILHSEEDWRCPSEQAEQLFAAYRRAGVDTTFVRFPAENHELTRNGSPRHRVERFVVVHDFFAEWLGGNRFTSGP